MHTVLKHLKLTHSAMFSPARFSLPKPNNPYHSDFVSVSDVNLWSDGIYTYVGTVLTTKLYIYWEIAVSLKGINLQFILDCDTAQM